MKLRNLDLFKTHPDYKELELTIEPKFKVGDKVVFGTLHETIAAVLRNERRYLCETCREILFKEQDRWHLAPKPHYGIENLKPFQKVLVRDFNNDKWRCAWFSDYDKTLPYSFITTGADYKQCIPFDINKQLLGTCDSCSDEFVNW